MRYLINIDKLIHLIGLAPSVSAAKRLRLAGAFAIGDGNEMIVVTDPKVVIEWPYPSEVDDA
jgi:hypothetical protein